MFVFFYGGGTDHKIFLDLMAFSSKSFFKVWLRINKKPGEKQITDMAEGDPLKPIIV